MSFGNKQGNIPYKKLFAQLQFKIFNVGTVVVFKKSAHSFYGGDVLLELA